MHCTHYQNAQSSSFDFNKLQQSWALPFGIFSLREVRLFQKQADDSKRLQSLQTDNEVMWRYMY